MNTQRKKITVPAIRAMKGKSRIGMLTAYDHPSAKIADAAGAWARRAATSSSSQAWGTPRAAASAT